MVKKQVWQPEEETEFERVVGRILEEIESLDAEDQPTFVLPIDRLDKALAESGVRPELCRTFARNLLEQERVSQLSSANVGADRLQAIREHLRRAADELHAAGFPLSQIAMVAASVATDVELDAHKARKKLCNK